MSFPMETWIWISLGKMKRISSMAAALLPVPQPQAIPKRMTLTRRRCECRTLTRAVNIWVTITGSTVVILGLKLGGGSDGKASACNAGDLGFHPWVGKTPWRRKWQPTPVLPGKSHGQRSLAGYSPWVSKNWTRLSDFSFFLYFFHFLFLSKTGDIKHFFSLDLPYLI